MFGLLLELIIFDINMWVIAKGTQTTRSDVNQSNAILTKIFPNGIKKTYLQYSVLAINIIVFLLRTGLAVNAYVESSDSFQEAISSIGPWAYKNIISNLWWILAIAVETIIAMSVVYCAVKVSDTGENRRLNVTELDQEYLEFSKPESIDARSDLILIAGDLSFLGVIPKKESILAEQKENCKKYLGTGAELSKYCEETCPLDAQLENSKSKCMGKSKQFAQLLELREKEVVLKVICKRPKQDGDYAYKQRIGRLMRIFGNDLHIRFMTDKLAHGICVLGRIKANGGIEELFWHWKDINHSGSYTVPRTKRADTSENKTLIYLLSEVLWDNAKEADPAILDECRHRYDESLKELDKVED